MGANIHGGKHLYLCVAQTLINCLLRKYFIFDLLCEIFGLGLIRSFHQCSNGDSIPLRWTNAANVKWMCLVVWFRTGYRLFFFQMLKKNFKVNARTQNSKLCVTVYLCNYRLCVSTRDLINNLTQPFCKILTWARNGYVLGLNVFPISFCHKNIHSK